MLRFACLSRLEMTSIGTPASIALSVDDHVRGWVAGSVSAIEQDGELAIVQVVDWDFAPTCRHCGRSV
jgi:hypothetical protein